MNPLEESHARAGMPTITPPSPPLGRRVYQSFSKLHRPALKSALFSTPHGRRDLTKNFMRRLRDRDRDGVVNSLKLPRNVMTCIKKGHGPGKPVKYDIWLAERIGR